MNHEKAAQLAAVLLSARADFLHVSDQERSRRRDDALEQARLLLQEPGGYRLDPVQVADELRPFTQEWGRTSVSLAPRPAVTVTTDKVLHSCRKVVVRATLVTRGGKVFVSENHVQHDPGSCPREGMPHGEGYHLCREVCRQPGHAETNVLGMAGGQARGGVIYLEGHDRLCQGCLEACSRAEVTVVREDGVVLLRRGGFSAAIFHAEDQANG